MTKQTTPSKAFLMRLPVDLRASLEAQAERMGIRLTPLIIALLRNSVEPVPVVPKTEEDAD